MKEKLLMYLLLILWIICSLCLSFVFGFLADLEISTATYISMAVTAAIFYVVYRCRKEKKDKQLANHHVNKITLHLRTVKKENFSYREIKELKLRTPFQA